MNRITRAKEIALSAMSSPPGVRERLIERACGTDTVLRAIVDDMLAPSSAADETKVLDEEPVGRPVAIGAAAAVMAYERPRYVQNLVGRRVGAYELVRRIGKGGMGSVYAARRVDQEFRKLVAVKVVKPGMETEAILQRFKHERQVLAGLDHPNIARLLDGGTSEGMPYLVMEYVEGTPIDEYCRSNRLSVDERLKLFCTVCAAVQYAHQSLVVHRDLKPGNILVTADGMPKLVDFGIAKVLNPEYGDVAALTQASERPMTPDYASPEQVRGDPITTASDVYALGLLLYELLTGQHPLRSHFKHSGFDRAVCEIDPERPSSKIESLEATETSWMDTSKERLRDRLKGDLDEIIMMALRKEPQRRYESVQHLVDDIQRHLNKLPVRAHGDSVRYRLRKFVRRHTAAAIATAAVAVALIASSVVSMIFYRQAVTERRLAETRFADVRQLAHFVLFDFDSVLSSGVTPARKAVIEKATEYLDRLSRDVVADRSLERELAEGYIKVGDLQGNLTGANLGDRAAARKSYDRALAVIESSRIPNPVLRAGIHVRRGDLLVQTSARDAVEAYEAARTIFEAQREPEPATRRAYLDALRKLAFARAQLGEYSEALRLYEFVVQRAEALTAEQLNPVDAERAIYYAELRAGEIMARMGAFDLGLNRMQRALAQIESRGAQAPASAEFQRPVATSSGLIGDILTLHGRHSDAAVYFRRALQVTESLAAVDPRNERYQRDLSNYLSRLATARALSGGIDEARVLTRRALQVLQPLIAKEASSEFDIYQYAWILLTTPCRDLQDPVTARQYASRLVAATQGQDPRSLDLLARAHAATGDPGRAVETAAKAVSLLPSDAANDLRAELEGNLASYRSAALSKVQRQRKGASPHEQRW